MLTRTLHWQLQVTSVQRGILHCIYAIYMNHTYQSAIDVQLHSHYSLFGSLCTDVCLLSYICISALYYSVHIVQLSCSVGSPTAGGWRYLLGVTTHPSSHPPLRSKQKAVGRWRERWCSGGTPSPTCWRQSVVQNGGTEDEPWREADWWVLMLFVVFASAHTLKSQSVQYDVWV